MFNALRHKTSEWLNSRWMYPALFVASLLESIVIPIPLEAVLVPLMQKRRERLWFLALVALLGCIAGAVVGYFVGLLLMDTIGRPFVEWSGQTDTLDRAVGLMDRQGFWFIMAVSVLPIPFQIAMLAAGATKYSFALFMLATAISRGLRYFGLAAMVWWLGDRAEAFMKRHKKTSIAIAVVAVAAMWIGSSFIAT